jgi:putative endonuclease
VHSDRTTGEHLFVSKTQASTPNRRLSLGRRGEQLAAAHLEVLGFVAIARNQRTRYGEIDLVAFDGDTLAFVEVKTRRVRARYGGTATVPSDVCPRAYLDAMLGWPASRQRRRLRRLALAWLRDPAHRRPRAHNIRFDVVRVLVAEDGRLVALEHVEGAC